MCQPLLKVAQKCHHGTYSKSKRNNRATQSQGQPGNEMDLVSYDHKLVSYFESLVPLCQSRSYQSESPVRCGDRLRSMKTKLKHQLKINDFFVNFFLASEAMACSKFRICFGSYMAKNRLLTHESFSERPPSQPFPDWKGSARMRKWFGDSFPFLWLNCWTRSCIYFTIRITHFL